MASTMAMLGTMSTTIPLHITNLPLFLLRVVSPALVLFATLSIIPSHPPSPESPSPITSVVVATRTPRRALILSLLSLSALTFFLDGLTFVVYTVFQRKWPQGTGIEIGALTGLIAFSGLAVLGAWKDIKGVEVWTRNRFKLVFGLVLLLDIAQVVLLGLGVTNPPSVQYLLHLAFPAFRVLLLFPLVAALTNPRISYQPVANGDEEIPSDSSLLLPAGEHATPSRGLAPLSAEASKYGTFRTGRPLIPTASGPTTRTPTPTPSSVRVPQPKRPQRTPETKEVNLDPSWGEIWHRLQRIVPFLWPSKSRALQGLALLCVLLVVIGRFVSFLTPYTFSQIVRIFEEDEGEGSVWPYLFAYVGLRFLQATGGLAALRDTLWVPVMQYSDREMSLLSFNHLLNLSLAFHTRRKTGEILRILDRGAAINQTLEIILFNIVPTFCDILVALVLFVYYFDWILASVIFFVMTAYVSASVILTRWRTKLRRQMNERDVITRGIHTDCLLNYETVKYFGGEQHESERYSDAIRQYQTLEYRTMISLNILNLVQNFIITVGLLIGSMLVALRVTRGESKPYEFVFFITYLAQLYGPLNMLGYVYRSVNQSLVDTEKLLKLLSEPTDVNDKPGAPDLIVENGTIEFENVSFSYDGRGTALNNVSFKVPKGSSVALVGESGSGKSTALRLLYRFYDLKEGEGRILIDGHDIRDVTQASLRKAIGVVPQDAVLFNASVAYNIGYGKFGSSNEEIEAAAAAAQMHERILSFPDGYETKVGERGVRLSGGEKQRVAIARTLLKNPPILLLDEATSALDTSTEKDIQKALQNLVVGRSSLSIAHRLSTIASADLILVLKDGQIVEQGTHAELVALDGVFASMWADQISSSDTASSHKKEAVTGYTVDTEEEPLSKPEADVETFEAPVAPDVPVDEPPKEVTEDLAPLPPAVEEIAVITPEPEPEPEVAAVEVPPENENATIEPTDKELPAPPVPEPEVEEIPSEPVAETSAPETAPAPVAFPTSEDSAPVAFPSSSESNTPEPVAFPTSESPAPVSFPTSESAPVAFPGSANDSSKSTPSLAVPERAATPGVTFQDTATPPRVGSPDVDQEGKRRRTLSTQNFQRLARRISLSNRRQGSSGSILNAIPGLKRDRDNARSSTDDSSVRGEGSTLRESPTASVQSEVVGKTKKDKEKEKKEKKDKKDRRKSGL